MKNEMVLTDEWKKLRRQNFTSFQLMYYREKFIHCCGWKSEKKNKIK